MRLINVHTKTPQEFYDEEVPPYAILSHTWAEEEVTFEDLTTGRGHNKRGYRKIRFLCIQAIEDGLRWAWLDTCCINKDSSAELSESINSMFRWYNRAECCYAFLSDMPSDIRWNTTHSAHTDPYNVQRELASARWFKRGWCLQELIAPRQVRFYGQAWNFIGDRDALSSMISRVTTIREEVLRDPQREIRRCSVAEKMSWAAARETSRIEDTAYCLLGIFEVNMPMLYGEGSRAFQRLQEEIIKSTDDHSIFVWQACDISEHHLLLAPHPSRFDDGALVVTIPSLHHVDGHTLRNTGLRISLPLSAVENQPGRYHGVLGCRYRDDYTNVIALCLQKRQDIDAAVDSDILPSALFVAPTIARSRRFVEERVPRRADDFPPRATIIISRTLPIAEQEEVYAGAKYWFDTGDTSEFSIVAAYPPEKFNTHTFVMDLTNCPIQYAAVLVSLSESMARAAGFDESTWHSRSLAVVFGRWTAPGTQFDADRDAIGIFGVVQTNHRNLANACRLAVSRSIYSSTDASQHHVAWVRSTCSVPWSRDHNLHISFRSDRRIGILREIVNVVSITLRSTYETPENSLMTVYQQADGTQNNPLGVERLQDLARSYSEHNIDDRRNSVDGPRSDVIYEMQDTSWPEGRSENDARDPHHSFATKQFHIISRDWRHKRSASGAKRAYYRKKRAFEKGRQPANTRIGAKRIHLVRTRGGNRKFRALRIDSGNFSWGSEGISRKVRVIAVAFHPSNNELVRTNTLTKSAVVQVDATPFRQWYEAHYGQALGRRRQQKAGQTEEEVKKSKSVENKQAERFHKGGKVESALERQFEAGRIYAVVASRPGQSGRCDGYILEGEELAFYQRAIKK